MSGQSERPPYPRPAVGVVVIHDDQLLLVQRSKDPYRGCWAVPGGKVKWGETLANAAAREVKEETGLVVEVKEVVWVGETMSPPGETAKHHNVLVDFAAVLVGGTLLAASDAADAAFIPLGEARDLQLTPTMYDLLDIVDPPPTYYIATRRTRFDMQDPPRSRYVSQSRSSV